MRLSVFDVLHRTVVYSLLGISGWAVFVGVYGHKERKAAMMEKVKANGCVGLAERGTTCACTRCAGCCSVQKIECDPSGVASPLRGIPPAAIPIANQTLHSSAAQIYVTNQLGAHSLMTVLIMFCAGRCFSRCCRLRYPSSTLDHQLTAGSNYDHSYCAVVPSVAKTHPSQAQSQIVNIPV
ncbi:hypothetical protein DFH06DRAFT_480092 [Mycena polygramma]|nr:hypothetical protein DFH06DRAFT_480092 [Mycena polygramma]